MSRPSNAGVRERLLAVGREVVYEKGFNGCGVQEITAAAGVPKGSFYNYFESKESFAVEIIEDYWRSIQDRHGSILCDAQLEPLVRVRKYFQELSRDHVKNGFAFGCLIGNLSLELSNVSDDARLKLVNLLGKWGAALAACLREAQDKGDLDMTQNANELATILIESYEGAVMRGKVERSARPCERFEKVVLCRLIR